MEPGDASSRKLCFHGGYVAQGLKLDVSMTAQDLLRPYSKSRSGELSSPCPTAHPL